MKKLLACALVALASGLAQAQVGLFVGSFSGGQENPPTPSPGFGTVTVAMDLGAHSMTIDASFADLISPVSVAHIHCCLVAPAVNVGVATTLPTFPGFPAGVLSGSYTNTFDTSLATTYNAGFITNFGGGTVAGAEAALFAGLMADNAYFNIHTAMFPGGEIRANLTPIPEPATYALLGAGLLGLALARRRRS
jgi:hypothetical protein